MRVRIYLYKGNKLRLPEFKYRLRKTLHALRWWLSWWFRPYHERHWDYIRDRFDYRPAHRHFLALRYILAYSSGLWVFYEGSLSCEFRPWVAWRAEAKGWER